MYASLLRRVAWDSLPCDSVVAYLPILDLIPSSAEGAAVEHRNSHKRLTLQEPLTEQIAILTAMSGAVLAALALALAESPEPMEIVATVTRQFSQTIQVGTAVTIANLIEDGYLNLGPKAMGK